ncbi:MAG: hypothetical protein FWC16_03505 [Defluviitaleaceae bacterium]|nr:hypothetical protein [Defluviitaleaceae bacterium]MCL2273969.1 hypothetical protein [Defluviitaleaceae bacterium]
MKNIVIAAKETDFEKALAAVFTREGYHVHSASDLPSDFNEPIEYLLDTTDKYNEEDTFTLTGGINADVIEQTLRENVLVSMALLERFLPQLDAGQGKRLFYISSAEASINETHAERGYGYRMSKAALHQFLQMTWNKLTPKGYTLRLFDPMTEDVLPHAAAEAAYHYVTRRRGMENEDGRRDDEDRLVLRDAFGRAHGW